MITSLLQSLPGVALDGSNRCATHIFGTAAGIAPEIAAGKTVARRKAHPMLVLVTAGVGNPIS
jgi:hypothetical protein